MVTNVIEEHISPRILEALFANFPSAEIAMLELTDNAIGDRIPDETMILTVRIKPSRIMVLNKGGYGMGVDRLRSFLTWGESRSTGVFRFYGQGGKAAIGYIGDKFKITTFPREGDRAYIIEETGNWTQRVDGKLKTFNVKEDPRITFDSGTVQIEIFGIKCKPNIKRMRHLIQSTYGKLIESGELKVLFNDKWLPPETFEYTSQIEFSERTPYGEVNGILGMTETASSTGIRCYSQNRLVKSKVTFGLNPTDYDLSKLAGEVHLDFVPVMPNKTGYNESGKEWLAVESVVQKQAEPILEKIKGISEVPPSLQRMAKDLSDFINKALREADLDFDAKGRKPQADIDSVKITFDKGLKPKQPSLLEPSTPPEIDDTGETNRLGFLDVKPEMMETENIRCRIVDKTAELNVNFPMAKILYQKPFKTSAYYSYALESVALEYYKGKVVTPGELVEKINYLLSAQAEKMKKAS